MCKATETWFVALKSRIFTFSGCAFVTLAAVPFHSFDRQVSNAKKWRRPYRRSPRIVRASPCPIAAVVGCLIIGLALRIGDKRRS